MTATLALIGIIFTAFGLIGQQALGDSSELGRVHLLLGFAALAGASLSAFLRLGKAMQPALRGPLLYLVARTGGICALAIGVYLAGNAASLNFDWTYEEQFTLSEASEKLLDALPGPLTLRLYTRAGDPRIRRTHFLLEAFAEGRGEIAIRVLDLADRPEDEDLFGIGSSNSVVVETESDWALVDRPVEGNLYEAIAQLTRPREAILYVALGAGEGDLARSGPEGYSGLAAALESAGFRLRGLPLSIADEIPADADGLLLISPRRQLPAPALAAIERFVARGGAVIAFLEPGVRSGLAELLSQYGIHSPDALVVDPSSLPVEGDPPGLNPVASAYAEHPITRGLNRNRMTFFRRARALELRKARSDDRLIAVVLSSPDAWTDAKAADLPAHSIPEPPPATRLDYRTLVAAAEVERGGPRARIVAFGDADLASNHYLRALYNLDLVINALHWALEDESAIALQPKRGGHQLIQFPIPLQNSLATFYGAGLLVPELLLVAGGLVWLRQRRG